MLNQINVNINIDIYWYAALVIIINMINFDNLINLLFDTHSTY